MQHPATLSVERPMQGPAAAGIESRRGRHSRQAIRCKAPGTAHFRRRVHRTTQGGREFFQQFVESADVRRAYSRLELKAGIAAADAAKHPQFDGFRIGLVDNRWVLVDPANDAADHPRVELKQSLQGNTYIVDYARARFSNDDETVEAYGDTARYTFEFIDGCWMLTGQTPAR